MSFKKVKPDVLRIALPSTVIISSGLPSITPKTEIMTLRNLSDEIGNVESEFVKQFG